MWFTTKRKKSPNKKSPQVMVVVLEGLKGICLHSAQSKYITKDMWLQLQNIHARITIYIAAVRIK